MSPGARPTLVSLVDAQLAARGHAPESQVARYARDRVVDFRYVLDDPRAPAAPVVAARLLTLAERETARGVRVVSTSRGRS